MKAVIKKVKKVLNKKPSVIGTSTTGNLETTSHLQFKASESDTETSKTKTEDLKAFRTIIMMLKNLQTSSGRLSTEMEIIGDGKDDTVNEQLTMLDALSALLIRQLEITAVVARPYDGLQLEVVVSATDPNNDISLVQPGTVSDPGHRNFWDRVLSFTATVNPRTTTKNHHNDSLMNTTPFPIITDCDESVPTDLAAADKENGSVLEIFLKTYWGNESFDTHVWMLKTLLQHDAHKSEPDKRLLWKDFRLYSIAVSFKKINSRMNNDISIRYFDCLQHLSSSFPANLSINLKEPKAGRISNRDKSFAAAIRSLGDSDSEDKVAFKTKIPNLRDAANMEDLSEMYNTRTCLEFHLLLCEMLSLFKSSLTKLVVIQKEKVPDLSKVLDALNNVWIFGDYLRVTVRSSIAETHFRTIESSLNVDSGKLWTSPSQLEDSDDADFQRLKPHSLRKGKPLLPWQSYRDWVMLMVLYFDAATTLTTFVANLQYPTISITILTPSALPEDVGATVFPWTELLKSERYFPTPSGESSGDDFIDILKTNALEVKVDKASSLASRLASRLATQLNNEPELKESTAMDEEIGQLATLVEESTPVGCEYVDEISEEIKELKKCEPTNRLARMRRVADMLQTLRTRANFYSLLKDNDSQLLPFTGTYHCEAYIGSLLALWGRPGSFSSFKELLNSSSVEGISQIEKVLVKIKDCNHVIGVSKRCCPVCSFLLHLLNRHRGTEFVVSDLHTNITSCELPQWLPGEIVHMMVVEFSRRLRVELSKLQKSIIKLRSRTRSNDTGRMSLESTRSVEQDWPRPAEVATARTTVTSPTK